MKRKRSRHDRPVKVWRRIDENTLKQFDEITKAMRTSAYRFQQSKQVLLDSTLLNIYGKQEGEDFNYHYSAHGYHPFLCYNGLTGALLKTGLRNDTTYTSNGATCFMKPLLDEFEYKNQ